MLSRDASGTSVPGLFGMPVKLSKFTTVCAPAVVAAAIISAAMLAARRGERIMSPASRRVVSHARRALRRICDNAQVSIARGADKATWGDENESHLQRQARVRRGSRGSFAGMPETSRTRVSVTTRQPAMRCAASAGAQ